MQNYLKLLKDITSYHCFSVCFIFLRWQVRVKYYGLLYWCLTWGLSNFDKESIISCNWARLSGIAIPASRSCEITQIKKNFSILNKIINMGEPCKITQTLHAGKLLLPRLTPSLVPLKEFNSRINIPTEFPCIYSL